MNSPVVAHNYPAERLTCIPPLAACQRCMRAQPQARRSTHNPHTHTPTNRPAHQQRALRLCERPRRPRGEIFSSFLTWAAEVLIALLSWQNFQGKRCYPWWISTVATSDWFFQLGCVARISYISLKHCAKTTGWGGAWLVAGNYLQIDTTVKKKKRQIKNNVGIFLCCVVKCVCVCRRVHFSVY